jgi:diphosphomevalonate decarboxylase
LTLTKEDVIHSIVIGAVPEWLGIGLQNRVHRFDSGRHLHLKIFKLFMHQKATTAYANANIALVKYWGKCDHALNIPAVSSLSMTLKDFGTTVSITKASELSVWIDGKICSQEVHHRVNDFLEKTRLIHAFSGTLNIASTSSVPYASGLASSAAFYAALATALNDYCAWGLSPQKLSTLARMGSASAARSIFPGFVGLYGGLHTNHDQAHAFPLKDHPDLDVAMLIAVVNTRPKAISSRNAMNLTQSTSPFFKAFVETHHQDFADAIAAIKTSSFERLGSIMEHSTLKMFATMMTAQPAIFYWQEQTMALINFVYKIRQDLGPIAYFTMDAGPQVKILTKKNHAEAIMSMIEELGLTQHLYRTSIGEGASIVDST